LTNIWVGKLLQVSQLVERGSLKSNLWNPPLYSVLRISGGRMSIGLPKTERVKFNRMRKKSGKKLFAG
ncbi:hypothetical protein, partial [Microseira wollei]|uniref:hypothetical protein n=1 Tax=Microseira wollei TaxID=467598 RepID=UPI001CFC7A06